MLVEAKSAEGLPAILNLLDFPSCCYFIRVKKLVPILQKISNQVGSCGG